MTYDDVEYYQISLNKDAVNSIADSLENNTYIPNTITLNIPEDTNFTYDGEYLIIREITSFDILDGYHRYIAMSKEYNLNPKFNYPMELRIVCFSDEKSRQFIYQEDQKTQMNKVDSDSYNQNDAGNQVVQMLNEKGILVGLVNRNSGIIDAATLANAIDAVYFASGKADRKEIITIKNKLYGQLEEIIDTNPNLLNKKWTTQFITCLIYLSSKDEDDLYKSAAELTKKIMSDEENRKLFSTRRPTKSLITRLSKI